MTWLCGRDPYGVEDVYVDGGANLPDWPGGGARESEVCCSIDFAPNGRLLMFPPGVLRAPAPVKAAEDK